MDDWTGASRRGELRWDLGDYGGQTNGKGAARLQRMHAEETEACSGSDRVKRKET